jgi:hypothetical protein
MMQGNCSFLGYAVLVQSKTPFFVVPPHTSLMINFSANWGGYGGQTLKEDFC